MSWKAVKISTFYTFAYYTCACGADEMTTRNGALHSTPFSKHAVAPAYAPVIIGIP